MKDSNWFLWDAHVCPPLKAHSDLSFLNRYKNINVNFVSLNVGFDLMEQREVFKLLEYFHQWINKEKDYCIVKKFDDLLIAKEKNQLAVGFDIEGINVLNGNLNILNIFYELGVRQLVLAYNKNNGAGGGCFDNDAGLTDYGKKIIDKANQLGIFIDCSHVGQKTSLEIIDYSDAPVIFSHSNPRSLCDNPRNIYDNVIIACAKKGGIIGINGVSIFLGKNDTSSKKIVEHIDYVTDLVGCEHVGIGLDCLFDTEEIEEYVKKNPDVYPSHHGFEKVTIAQPEQILEIKYLLEDKKYKKEDISNILGNNFFRLSKLIWK